MSVTYGFYNSSNGDSLYDAIDISRMFDGVITDGVYMSIGDHLAVTASSGMQLLVGEGRAWFDHTWTRNDAPYPITIPSANLLLPRIDAVILEVGTASRVNGFKVLSGTPASSPQKPVLTNNADLHQYALAYVTVPAGATSISQSNIENNIGMEGCPFVTGIMESINIESLVAQWQDEFYKWFDTITGILDDNAAGNLQNEFARNTPFVYKAHFTVSDWDGTNPYTQTVSLTPVDGGGNITTSSTFVNQPLVEQGDTEAETSNRQDCLAILCSGKVVVSGQNEITATVYDVPEMDFDAYFVMKVR